MLQIIQYQKTGEMFVEELPEPQLKSGGILVRNVFSLISAGTERTSVETAQASMIGKAKSRPDLVKQVLDNVKRDGFVATYEKVKNRLDNYKELGYSSAGIVIESSLDEFKVGDRVACAGFAHHAEYISIPKNLAAKMPDKVTFEDAAFTTLGTIALQGVRQAEVSLGDSVAVIGLGLVGLITIQLLKANGCRVIGLDINESNFQLAKKFGCNECVVIDSNSSKRVLDFTKNKGVDSAIVTASTKSNDPFEKAIEFVRKKGKVVVVGRVGMEIPYLPSYEKEIEVKMSCSYGPGRYDSSYEERGLDYPLSYVRWTENRNMEAILDLLADGKLDFKPLITHQFQIADALKAYDIITNKVHEKYIGILICYPELDQLIVKHLDKVNNKKFESSSSYQTGSKNLNLAFIGAGNFAQSYLLPNLKKNGVNLKTIVTSKPANAKSVSEKFNFESFSTDSKKIIANEEIGTIFIATRHDSHGKFVLESLKHNKNVYVEKPLCIDENELSAIVDQYQKNSVDGKSNLLMVGYNRRFSEPIGLIKKFFIGEKEPMFLNYRINAGFIPKTNWYQSQEQKGRIIGETCHFIDTICFLTGAKPQTVYASALSDNSERYSNDNVSMTINFSDRSVGNLIYLANGSKVMEKEYLEVTSAGKSAKMWDFKEVELFDSIKMTKKKFSGDKGYAEEMKKVVEALKTGKEHLIPFEELILTTLTTFKALKSIKEGTVEKIEF
ncbi:MAG: bi-domain-containing oxidoreductase [Melioribacteraceae bacterium]